MNAETIEQHPLIALIESLPPEELTFELSEAINRKLKESAVNLDYKKLQDDVERHRDVIHDMNHTLGKYQLTAEKYLATLPKYRKGLLMSQRKKLGKLDGASPAVSVPKYQHPDNPDKTWVGVGNKPQWVREHLNAGGSLDDLLIKDNA